MSANGPSTALEREVFVLKTQMDGEPGKPGVKAIALQNRDYIAAVREDLAAIRQDVSGIKSHIWDAHRFERRAFAWTIAFLAALTFAVTVLLLRGV